MVFFYLLQTNSLKMKKDVVVKKEKLESEVKIEDAKSRKKSRVSFLCLSRRP